MASCANTRQYKKRYVVRGMEYRGSTGEIEGSALK
jgi:hypothetical protein